MRITNSSWLLGLYLTTKPSRALLYSNTGSYLCYSNSCQYVASSCLISGTNITENTSMFEIRSFSLIQHLPRKNWCESSSIYLNEKACFSITIEMFLWRIILASWLLQDRRDSLIAFRNEACFIKMKSFSLTIRNPKTLITRFIWVSLKLGINSNSSASVIPFLETRIYDRTASNF
jgi:hypothetical protein